ncbi:hypothetical protein K439DRAFT_1026749 [Ramaria rubella]|nr:hypothetical protein K439DRAFT_1026749 [Ramaria rubella]
MILRTLVSRSSSSLLQHLSKANSNPDAVILFSVSTNALNNLEDIVSRLRLSARHIIGCLSAPLPGAPETVVCSTATFSAQDCVPFRSEIRGRAPIQVGRSSNRKTTIDHSISSLSDFTDGPLAWGSFGSSVQDPQLPSELLGQRDINSVLFFSDDAPEGLVQSLNNIRDAENLGLTASSTPFITGRPFTLFYNDCVYSSGAVGIALRNSFRPTPNVVFHGLVPLSAPMKVSKSEGNLIHELDQSNPVKMLIEAIATDSRMNQGKDEIFFMGHLSNDPSSIHEVRRVYRILSGGPSRGSIALAADSAPTNGEIFFSQSPNSPSAALATLKSQTHRPSIRFLCSSEIDMTSLEQHPSDKYEERIEIFENIFIAATENGFLCTKDASSTSMWKCVVPGALGGLTWNRKVMCPQILE